MAWPRKSLHRARAVCRVDYGEMETDDDEVDACRFRTALVMKSARVVTVK